MAVIAMKQAESGNPVDANEITSIPLNKLVPWDGNVRKTRAEEGLEELIASIAALGVLQSLVVRKASRGKYSIIAGRRRFLALSALAEAGKILADAPVPCSIVPGDADATEISLSENVVRAPMHPADQFEAFRTLIDSGATAADVAARFGMAESTVKKRLKLGRVSPKILEAYRNEELDLEQVQAFAISDDHAEQEKVFEELAGRRGNPHHIRRLLTQDEIPATDRKARYVGVEPYEAAGGTVRRDLFADDEDGVFLLDAGLLDRLALEKLQAGIETVSAEGWKWVDAFIEFDYEARAAFERLHPEPLPLSPEAEAEHKRLSEEHESLSDSMKDDDEEASERLDALQSRIDDLEDTGTAFTPESLAIAGAVITISRSGEFDVIRGLVRPEDLPEADEAQEAEAEASPKVKAPYSALLVQQLTQHRSAAISATLMHNPQVALAAMTFAVASDLLDIGEEEGCLQLSAKRQFFTVPSKGAEALEAAAEIWKERLPQSAQEFWAWCLAQRQEILLDLLAFCAAATLDAVYKQHGDESFRLEHAGSIAQAVGLDMPAWFTPDAVNYFGRVSRPQILSAITEATGRPPKRSWDKLKKSELAALAARETAGTRWLPEPVRQ